MNTVTDFTSDEDLIAISSTNFGGGLVSAGTMDVQNVASLDDAFSFSTRGYFIYEDDGTDGTLYWDQNGANSADAVAIAQLLDIPSLRPEDFLIA